jgi:hypothetical protein
MTAKQLQDNLVESAIAHATNVTEIDASFKSGEVLTLVAYDDARTPLATFTVPQF